ncbi:MAG: hypothetical protein DIU71_12295, partial [Proteobacteria bacterium]
MTRRPAGYLPPQGREGLSAPVPAPPAPGLGRIAGLVVWRDLKMALRHWDQVLQPLIFFVIVTTLFPLAISPALD